jgi:hypothetical protein
VPLLVDHCHEFFVRSDPDGDTRNHFHRSLSTAISLNGTCHFPPSSPFKPPTLSTPSGNRSTTTWHCPSITLSETWQRTVMYDLDCSCSANGGMVSCKRQSLTIPGSSLLRDRELEVLDVYDRSFKFERQCTQIARLPSIKL